ncbi:MAG: glycoside hydrolase family 3 C-terminal domain-containing protein [Mangrovibacterium sp.]
MKPNFLLALFLLLHLSSVSAQELLPYENLDLSMEERVEDLVSRMTLEEKISQLIDASAAIDRLGVPRYNWWNESLHGVARAGYATVFPQSISIAASWDQDLVHEVASSISDEARAKYNEYQRNGQADRYQGLTMWSPNINIFRDPRWGRGHETYGEDPYLTGILGGAYVKGLQGDNDKYLKVVATAKHWAVHSGPEPLRHEFEVNVSDRDLFETYLPAFRMLVKDDHVYSVMGAYNSFRNEACCSNHYLFDILRSKWGFKGYVVSDCAAIRDIWRDHKQAADASEASAMALKAGTDLNCGNTYTALKEAMKKGLCTTADIDAAVKRLFLARFRLGMFDPKEVVPYSRIPYSMNNNPAHNHLARRASQESIVLLKNENHTLPLSKKVKTIAVIGPNADNIQSLWGNYSGVPSNPITVLQGIKNKLSPDVNIIYEPGCGLAKGIPLMNTIPSRYFETEEGQQGLTAEYFANSDFQQQPLFTQVDDKVDFCWDNGTPDPRLKTGMFSVRWSGYLIAPKTGTYYISEWSKPYMTVTIDGTESGGKNGHHPRVRPKVYELEAGKKYKVVAEYANTWGDATARLIWATPDANKMQRAVEAAKKADAVVLALGLNERLEGEEMSVDVDGFYRGDRTSLNLPREQEKLMKAIVATGKPVVLTLIAGSALSVNWAADNVPAILSAGYPGQQGGNAIADVIFGDYNPAGRLPVTYYKSVDQLPDFENYDMEGRTYRYFKQEPLYPFGFGLSYTNFEYHNLQVIPAKDASEVKVSVEVTNTGERVGDEVVQVYLTDEKSSTERPIRTLVAFNRINLKIGETKKVEFSLQPRRFSMVNKKGNIVIEKGYFKITVGGEQEGFKGRCDAPTTNTISKRIELGNNWVQQFDI